MINKMRINKKSPIDFEDPFFENSHDEIIPKNNRTNHKQKLEDSISDKIPCEICGELYDFESILIHQVSFNCKLFFL